MKTRENPFGSAAAYRQAAANANYFGRPYVVLCDTSGNYRWERLEDPTGRQEDSRGVRHESPDQSANG